MWEESPPMAWTFPRTVTGSRMSPIQRECCGGANWMEASDFSLLRFRCNLGYLAGRPMENELLFRLGFLESRTESTWLRQTEVVPSSSLQRIMPRLTRTGHQTRIRWYSEASLGWKVVRRVPSPSI